MIPRVSVIIPNYNHSKFLGQRIDSVIYQTFQDFEIIILDDHSTDDSKSITETYRKHSKVSQIIYNEKNSGSTFKQWKKGIELARSELIWIAESDDWCDMNFLTTLVDKLTDDTISLAYCRTINVVENQKQSVYQWGEALQPEIWNTDQTFDGKEFINSFMKYRNIIPNASAVLFRKKYFKDIEAIFKMRYAGDWFLWTNLASRGNIAYSAKKLNYYRDHSATTRSVKSVNEEVKRIEEHFISIQEACNKVDCRFNPFDKEYNYLIQYWINKIKTFGKKQLLFPPFPFLFLMRFYYTLLISKI